RAQRTASSLSLTRALPSRAGTQVRSGRVLRCVRRGVINAAGVPTCIRRGRFFLFAQIIKARGIQVALQSPSQLHSYRGRRDVVVRLDAESWCLSIGLCLAAKPKQSGFVVDERSEPTLAIATDAMSNPTTRAQHPGGIHGEREGSNPSSTTEHQ